MKVLLLLLALSYGTIEGARILAVLPTVAKSHYASGKKIVLALAERGHDVVVISPFEEKNAPKTFHWIPMRLKHLNDAVPDGNKFLQQPMSFYNAQHRLWLIMNQYTDYVTQNLTEVRDFIENDNSHFDLVLVEDFFQYAFYTFAYKYKAPLILLSTFGTGHYINEYTGNALEVSYVPHEFLDLYGELNIFERAKNLAAVVYDFIGRRYYSLRHQNELARRVFKLPNQPNVADIEREAALVLVNSHFSMSMVQPFVPNIIEIAGIHMDDVKPLDENFKAILDNAKHGVVLFSFGSVLDLSRLPKDFVTGILNALGSIKQEVLIKWGSDEEPSVRHNNIRNFKWLPQNDILAHPNTIAFVTHGGLQSTIETIHHGIPTICVPFFGDQFMNCKRSVKMGFGIYLDRESLTEEFLKDSLDKAINVPDYRKKAKVLSKRFQDRPQKPMDLAMFWIEYVIRHDGADFIKGPKRYMYWFQYLFLDVFILVLISIWLVVKLVKGIIDVVVKKAKGDKKVKNN